MALIDLLTTDKPLAERLADFGDVIIQNKNIDPYEILDAFNRGVGEPLVREHALPLAQGVILGDAVVAGMEILHDRKVDTVDDVLGEFSIESLPNDVSTWFVTRYEDATEWIEFLKTYAKQIADHLRSQDLLELDSKGGVFLSVYLGSSNDFIDWEKDLETTLQELLQFYPEQVSDNDYDRLRYILLEQGVDDIFGNLKRVVTKDRAMHPEKYVGIIEDDEKIKDVKRGSAGLLEMYLTVVGAMIKHPIQGEQGHEFLYRALNSHPDKVKEYISKVFFRNASILDEIRAHTYEQIVEGNLGFSSEQIDADIRGFAQHVLTGGLSTNGDFIIKALHYIHANERPSYPTTCAYHLCKAVFYSLMEEGHINVTLEGVEVSEDGLNGKLSVLLDDQKVHFTYETTDKGKALAASY